MRFKGMVSGCFLMIVLGLSIPACPASLRQTPVVKVVQDNIEAVVNISTERIIYLRQDPFWGNYGSEFDLFFNQFFSSNFSARPVKLKSIGSGVILDASGTIITNAHVVSMASNIYVVFSDGSEALGQVMYQNAQDDLAIIKIDPVKKLKAVKLAAGNDVMVGESVVAIGNPLGLENTVTAGIVSGKDRRAFYLKGEPIPSGLLQLDAPINPGNSGGALFNLDGELIGVNVAVVQNAQNVGFAIPVDRVKEALNAYQQNKDTLVNQKKTQEPLIEPGFNSIRERMDKMVDSVLDRGDENIAGAGSFESSVSYSTDLGLKQVPQGYQWELEAGDLENSKVGVEVNNGFLTVTVEGSKIIDKQNQAGKYSYQSYSSFARTITLPKDADTAKIKTTKGKNKIVINIPKKK